MARGNYRAAAAADGKQVSVRLTEPAKVNGRRREPGTVITVSEALAAQLAANGAGLLGEDAAPPSEPSAPAAPAAAPADQGQGDLVGDPQT